MMQDPISSIKYCPRADQGRMKELEGIREKIKINLEKVDDFDDKEKSLNKEIVLQEKDHLLITQLKDKRKG